MFGIYPEGIFVNARHLYRPRAAIEHRAVLVGLVGLGRERLGKGNLANGIVGTLAENHFHAYFFHLQAAQVQTNSKLGFSAQEQSLLRIGYLNIHAMHLIPTVVYVQTPLGQSRRLLILLIRKGFAARSKVVVVLFVVVVQLAAHGKVGRNLGHVVFDVLYPRRAHAAVLGIERRHNLVFDNFVDGFGVQLILINGIVVGLFLFQSPAGPFAVALGPPAVEHTQIQNAVHNGFFAARAGSFQRPGGRIDPHVHALHQVAGHIHVVVFDKDDFTAKFTPARHVQNLFYQILTRFVGRVRLAGKDKLHGAAALTHNFGQAFQVAQQKVGAFIGGKPTGKAESQRRGVERGEHLDHLLRRVATRGHFHLQALLDKLDKTGAQVRSDFPDFFVGHFVNVGPMRSITHIIQKRLAKVFFVELLPKRMCPRLVVHPVGNVTDVLQLFWIVAGIHGGKYLAAHAAVNLTYAVDFFREVGREETHGELIARTLVVFVPQGHKLFPLYFEALGVGRHIGTHDVFRKRIVARRHGGMGGKERGRPYQFFGLQKRQMLVFDIFSKTFHAHKGAVSLVAVIHFGLETQGAQHPYPANAEQHLLLKAIFPIAAIKLVGNAAVGGRIFVNVGV